MPQSIISPDPSVNPRAHLRVIRDEEAPPYDGEPPTRAEHRHMTVIDDEAVDAVLRLCGPAASGVYMYLERRVNVDGVCDPSYDTIAADCGVSRRYAIELVGKLEVAGFVGIHKRVGRFGIHQSNQFFLPYHRQAQEPRTYYGEPGSEPGSEPSCARQQEEVVTSNVNSAAAKKKKQAKMKPTTPDYSPDFVEFWALYPGRNGKKQTKAESFAVWEQLSDDDRTAARAGVVAYCETDDVLRGYALDAVRWLKRRRWEDETVETPDAPSNGRPHVETDAERMQRNTDAYTQWSETERIRSEKIFADIRALNGGAS